MTELNKKYYIDFNDEEDYQNNNYKSNYSDNKIKHTDHKYFIDISLEELPEFAELMLTHEYITDKEKFRFVNTFLEKYLTNNDYRQIIQNCYLYMIDGKFWNIISTDLKDAEIPEHIPGYKKHRFLITDNPIKRYMGFCEKI